jgi:hypothetical protein
VARLISSAIEGDEFPRAHQLLDNIYNGSAKISKLLNFKNLHEQNLEYFVDIMTMMATPQRHLTSRCPMQLQESTR